VRAALVGRRWVATTTERLERQGGWVAYSAQGDGPLVVCAPGLGDLREEYRFLTPALVAAGFRVAALDLRGHGGSSTGWDDYSAEAVGADVLALVKAMGASRALVVGTSMAAGSAVWAAAEEPELVAGVVLIGPFVRDIGSPGLQRLLQGAFRILLARPWGLSFWMRYWASLFPTRKPDDFDAYAGRLRANLSEPDRFAAVRAMMLGPSRHAIEARLDRLEQPALVVMGTKDRDFKDPPAEAELVAARVGGNVELVEDAGHYPHVEFPGQTAEAIVEFARSVLAEERDEVRTLTSTERKATG
jgi:pimeloyl-ACP methyl ester carboxylesterase